MPVFLPYPLAEQHLQSSNATSWKRPVIAAEDIARKSSSTTETNASASGGTGDCGGNVQAEVTGPLPSGWTEVKDPKTGGVYFWNQVGVQ